MRRTLTVIGVLFQMVVCFAQAQKQATIWYFGKRAGLDFSSGSPRVLSNSAMNTAGGSAVMCDAQSGALLFYTNGYRIWNRRHQPMPGDDPTYPLDCPNGASQVAVAPVPGSPQRYYVFSLHPQPDREIDNLYCISGASATDPWVLKYRMIDMDANEGDGRVITSNVALAGDVTEKMVIVAHGNGRNYWLVAHQWDTNIFRAYSITAAGMGEPVETGIGSRHGSALNERGDFSPFGDQKTGQMKISPNGKKLAIALPSFEGFNYPLELFDFDNNTGKVSNLINLGGVVNQYGLSFSPDNSKLYSQSYSPRFDARPVEGIVQYDLNAGDSTALIASRMSILTGNPYTNIDDIAPELYLSMQLAPDGKLYGVFARTGVYDSRRMVVIANPNAKGFDCQVNAVLFDFPVKDYWAGLPNFMDSYFNNLPPLPDSGEDCTEMDLILFPNPARRTVTLSSSCGYVPAYVEIIDCLGRIVDTQYLAANKVEVTSLAEGLYVFRIFGANQKPIVRKLIKL